ncbi:MAG TPA: histidine phosphatase family protein [Bacilli bacterium]
MKTIYLIRHCKASGQEPQAPLTEEGIKQAEELASFFHDKKIDYIVSSPYDRAVMTVHKLAGKLNVTIHTDERLRERVLTSEIIHNWMDKLAESFEDPDMKLVGGESAREAMARGITLIEEIIMRPEKNIAVITHGNLMALILAYYTNEPGYEVWRRLTNPDVYAFAVENSAENIMVKRIWK